MQALKQAAREGDSVKLDALCEEWSVSSAAPAEISPAGLGQAVPAGPIEAPNTDADPAPGAAAKKSLEKVS
jgi:hypothetical protein